MQPHFTSHDASGGEWAAFPDSDFSISPPGLTPLFLREGLKELLEADS
jgi:hypothetical protein